MSIAANQWAWTRRCSPGAKLLLLALADHCNGRPGGCECWPSMARLSDMTGFSKASICRHLAELEQQGHIRRVRSNGRTSTVYRLQMASQLSQDETVEPPQLSQNETVGPSQLSQIETVEAAELSQNETVEPAQLSQIETQLSQNETQRSQIETRTSKEPERTGTTLSRERAPEPAPSTKTATGSRLTLSTLPPDWATWALTKRPDLDPQHTWELFRDYWTAKPGKDGLKTDWFATWRNWVRRERSPNGRTADATAHPSDSRPTIAAKDFTLGATRPEDLPDWARDCAGNG